MISHNEHPNNLVEPPAVPVGISPKRFPILSRHWPGPNWIPLAVAAHGTVERIVTEMGREQ